VSARGDQIDINKIIGSTQGCMGWRREEIGLLPYVTSIMDYITRRGGTPVSARGIQTDMNDLLGFMIKFRYDLFEYRELIVTV